MYVIKIGYQDYRDVLKLRLQVIKSQKKSLDHYVKRAQGSNKTN